MGSPRQARSCPWLSLLSLRPPGGCALLAAGFLDKVEETVLFGFCSRHVSYAGFCKSTTSSLVHRSVSSAFSSRNTALEGDVSGAQVRTGCPQVHVKAGRKATGSQCYWPAFAAHLLLRLMFNG